MMGESYRVQIPSERIGGKHWATVATFCDYDWATAWALQSFPSEPWRVLRGCAIVFDTRRDDVRQEAARVGV